MVRALSIDDFLARTSPVLDVRSPGEHYQGHIPGAVSFPLFSDAERAVVGTLYKREGRDPAMLESLRIVGPKLAAMVEQARAIAPDGTVRVHCWRGGERSGSVAWLLDKAGFAEVHTLRGGYKAFRNQVLTSFERTCDLRVIGGYTGTGKTELLSRLAALGQQVIDLEALAHHKGSSFGALGEEPQPTSEQFENRLWAVLRTIDPARPCWVEDESHMIGRVRIPNAFFARLRAARLYFIDMPRIVRADRLVVDYGKYPKEQLAEAVKRIEKRMGPQHCKAALQALEAGDLRTVALLTLEYYDKAYLHGVGMRYAEKVLHIPANQHDGQSLAKAIIHNAQNEEHAG
jgi:tRNA 2-selenouridine synthase